MSMTSTSFTIGLQGDGARSSSRVLRPPGGGHTDIFGGEPEPTRGRRQGYAQPPCSIGQGDEPKPKSNGVEPAQNGNLTPEQPSAPDSTPEPQPQVSPVQPEPKMASPMKEAPPSPAKPEPAQAAGQTDRAEPQKRVRVPPGGFSSGLCKAVQLMEGGGRSRLGRLLNKLRGDHHKFYLDKGISFTSTAMSESTGCGSNTEQITKESEDTKEFSEDTKEFSEDTKEFSEDEEATHTLPHTSSSIDDDQFAANIDLRYGGQYLTPEQLPMFCEQLHHLVEVIRNIQSYAKVTGEYPTSLERRLEREAREVAALAAETRNARDVAARTRTQRRALAAHRAALQGQLATLKDTEVKEFESTVRLSDRKLFKNWESLKETNDPVAFEPLLEEIRTKQAALECLLRLIEGRRAAVSKPAAQPLPPPRPKDHTEESSALPSRKRHEARRNKRRRKEPRSVPLSGEPSEHAHPTQVRVYIQGAEPATPLPALELPSGGSVRDILFFTTTP